MTWRADVAAFDRWAKGQTGLPFVDACMRELAGTGYMSNRGRQNVASFLAKVRTRMDAWRHALVVPGVWMPAYGSCRGFRLRGSMGRGSMCPALQAPCWRLLNLNPLLDYFLNEGRLPQQGLLVKVHASGCG